MSETIASPTASDINVIDHILAQALNGDDISTADALTLLTQTAPDVIERIRATGV